MLRVLLPILAAVSFSPAAAADTEVAVLFNTVCAQCHEMECSGRMGLCQSADAARPHLERHAGPLSPDMAEGLFALLQRTKLDCRIIAPAVPVPSAGRWPAAEIARLGLPQGTAYFIPLGPLPAGSYRLTADMAQPAEAEVLGESGRLFDDTLSPGEVLRFAIGAGGEALFLRLRGRTALGLGGLRLERE